MMLLLHNILRAFGEQIAVTDVLKKQRRTKWRKVYSEEAHNLYSLAITILLLP
jgi:hypothetical protein